MKKKKRPKKVVLPGERLLDYIALGKRLENVRKMKNLLADVRFHGARAAIERLLRVQAFKPEIASYIERRLRQDDREGPGLIINGVAILIPTQ